MGRNKNTLERSEKGFLLNLTQMGSIQINPSLSAKI